MNAFGPEFLAWFRAATEAAWARVTTPTLADFERAGVGGARWQQGTQWTGGFTEEEIAAAEEEHRVVFPPDLRLFLRTLGATDRPCVGAAFQGDRLVPRERAGFYDWRRDRGAIVEARAAVVEGLEFDVEHNALWLDEWGARPADAPERAEIVRRAVAAAPPLLPLMGHRFLVGEPAVAGNPVLSVHQSDIIVFGGDLRAYLLAEFASLIGAGHEGDAANPSAATFARACAVPFWGVLVS